MRRSPVTLGNRLPNKMTPGTEAELVVPVQLASKQNDVWNGVGAHGPWATGSQTKLRLESSRSSLTLGNWVPTNDARKKVGARSPWATGFQSRMTPGMESKLMDPGQLASDRMTPGMGSGPVSGQVSFRQNGARRTGSKRNGA